MTQASDVADMKELREQSDDLHNHSDSRPVTGCLSTVIFWSRYCAGTGSISESQMFPLGCLLFQAAEKDQFEDLCQQVKESLKDQILIKGSNSMNCLNWWGVE